MGASIRLGQAHKRPAQLPVVVGKHALHQLPVMRRGVADPDLKSYRVRLKPCDGAVSFR